MDKFTYRKGVFSMIYAYARVSSRDQNLDRQLKAFAVFGINDKKSFPIRKPEKTLNKSNRLVNLGGYLA